MDKNNFSKILKKYDYRLPEELIAKKPASPRDGARLLVYNRRSGKISYDIFKNLPKYLPPRAVLVFNQTKVLPARLTVQKSSGGLSRILYLNHRNGILEVLSDRSLPAGSTVALCGKDGKVLPVKLAIKEKRGSHYFLKLAGRKKSITTLLKKYGHVPLPPYIKNSPLSENQRRRQYQTVFAKSGRSVAAPTASLHFTKRLAVQLGKSGIDSVFLNLDVGLGTFAPLKPENLKNKKLHSENFKISRPAIDFLKKAVKQGRPIIAVGTTVTRALETAFLRPAKIKASGSSELFITQGFKFKAVGGLITNFHVPKSSLMMLVAAFIGRKKLLDLYQKAIHRHFKFFSFGDAMLILP